MFDIWTKKEPLAEEIYQKDNYRIMENPSYPENLCILYFCSNDIWFPNTEKAFRYSFVEHDYYEWIKRGSRGAKKAIYFRDIYKSWYVTGVNDRLKSISLLIEFIKKETEGMEVITVGSSAGGYMATLVGALIGAKRAIAFSAQFNLNFDKGALQNPLLCKYRNEKEYSQFYELASWIEGGNTPIYYIMPAYNEEDRRHYEYIKSVQNVKTIRIATKRHGVPVLRKNLDRLLTMGSERLNFLFDQCQEREISRFGFSVLVCGFFKSCVYFAQEVYHQISKRIKKKLRIK